MGRLVSFYAKDTTDVGCDEAGRGCLAGPVFAAAVILPNDFFHPKLNDSKQMKEKDREELRIILEKEALDYAVCSVSAEIIDDINILQASFKAMHMALDKIKSHFDLILVDGNRFRPYKTFRHETIIGGDGKFAAIAAASVLAKTYRDTWMREAHAQYPEYDWINNKGYGTQKHRDAIKEFGLSPLHRKSFQLKEQQMKLSF